MRERWAALYRCDQCGLTHTTKHDLGEEVPCYVTHAYHKRLEARGLGKRSKKLTRTTREFVDILMKESGCKGRMPRQKRV